MQCKVIAWPRRRCLLSIHYVSVSLKIAPIRLSLPGYAADLGQPLGYGLYNGQLVGRDALANNLLTNGPLGRHGPQALLHGAYYPISLNSSPRRLAAWHSSSKTVKPRLSRQAETRWTTLWARLKSLGKEHSRRILWSRIVNQECKR